MNKIKGWTKSILQTGRILYLSEKTAMGVQYSPRGNVFTPWAVDIHDRMINRLILLKRFRTKTAALNYATSYMRSHPRG